MNMRMSALLLVAMAGLAGCANDRRYSRYESADDPYQNRYGSQPTDRYSRYDTGYDSRYENRYRGADPYADRAPIRDHDDTGRMETRTDAGYGDRYGPNQRETSRMGGDRFYTDTEMDADDRAVYERANDPYAQRDYDRTNERYGQRDLDNRDVDMYDRTNDRYDDQAWREQGRTDQRSTDQDRARLDQDRYDRNRYQDRTRDTADRTGVYTDTDPARRDTDRQYTDRTDRYTESDRSTDRDLSRDPNRMRRTGDVGMNPPGAGEADPYADRYGTQPSANPDMMDERIRALGPNRDRDMARQGDRRGDQYDRDMRSRDMEGQWGQIQPANVEQAIEGWPDASRTAAEAMIAKYGAPDHASDMMLCWKNNGPWEKTVVFKEETDHNFPMPHKDVLEQCVSFKVPPDKVDELAKFDGSLKVDRTRGILSATCDKEEMNFLALNLAHDIIIGNKTVEEARDHLARAAAEFKKGQADQYTQRLHFEAMARAADPDNELEFAGRGEEDLEDR